MFNLFKNLNIYNKRMASALDDKIFYTHLFSSVKVFYDFGCADGSLIKRLATEYPNIHFIGYDCNDDMIALARKNTAGLKNVTIVNSIVYMTVVNREKANAILNFSSVLHEVLNYSTPKELQNFWEDVSFIINHGNVVYITFRDMLVDKKWSYVTFSEETRQSIVTSPKISTQQVKDFEYIYGDTCFIRNMVHLLLKYKYVENWDREVKENYLGIPSLESLIDAFKSSSPKNAEVIYYHHYTLPYLREQVKKDFGINLDCPTHVKLIIKVKGCIPNDIS